MSNEMKDREIAIQISGVKKMYKLGQIGGATLQQELQSWWARVRGREDPNTVIGSDQRLFGQTFMALNGIDLTVYKGEALGIIGGNGAGKSTLLKLLCQVTAPTEGEIDIYGRIASMLEVGTGFNTEMTGRENVYMNGAILGMTRAEIDAKMEDIIDFSEIREFIDTPSKRYSSGMYVKLAFAVAAHLDSEIMIMDEVLAVGDMAFQKKCLTKMREAATKEGRTVLYVSHNMNTIRELCDRCIVLNQGKKIFEGDVEHAIQIYMNQDAGSGVTEFDLLNSPNRVQRCRVNTNAKMVSLKLLGKSVAQYSTGEQMLVQVCARSYRPIPDLNLRFEIRYADGTPVGTVSRVQLGQFEADQQREFQVELDFIGLTDGQYRVDMVLFEKDELGNSQDLDLILPAFYFTVEYNQELAWNTSNWGHIRFPDARVTPL